MSRSPLHLVSLLGLERDWVLDLFEHADWLRARRPGATGGKAGGHPAGHPTRLRRTLLRRVPPERGPGPPRPLAGRTAALVFHKPSLRTRVSFTAGMHELGGDVVDLGAAEVSENGRESLGDVAQVLSGMCDLIVVRTFAHRIVQQLAEHARVPVINALTDFSHPCQILSDLYTLRRAGRDLDALTVAWVGDGNNVLNSWLEAATIFGFSLRIAVPDGFEPDAGLFLEAERRRAPGGAGRGNGAGNGAGRAPREAGPRSGVRRFRDPAEAVLGADVVYTDTWTSMGQEQDAEWRRVVFAGYQVDEALMRLASPDALFMHCLPAHRGEEVTDAVLDGPRSIVIEQAENRLHLQKALMTRLVEASGIARAAAGRKTSRPAGIREGRAGVVQPA